MPARAMNISQKLRARPQAAVDRLQNATPMAIITLRLLVSEIRESG